MKKRKNKNEIHSVSFQFKNGLTVRWVNTGEYNRGRIIYQVTGTSGREVRTMRLTAYPNRTNSIFHFITNSK